MNKYVMKIPTKVLRIIPMLMALSVVCLDKTEYFSHMTMLVITLTLIPFSLLIVFELKRRKKTEVTEF